MHVKNIYPLNTADDLIKLAGTASFYLSNITEMHTAIDISTALPEEYINDIIADCRSGAIHWHMICKSLFIVK